MKTFLQPLQNLAEMEEIQAQAKNNRGVLAVSGCMESQKAHMIYGLSGLFPCHLVISEDERSAKQIYEDYRFYEKNVYYYPARDLLFFQADIHGNLLIRQRMQVIRALLTQRRSLWSLVWTAVWIFWRRFRKSVNRSLLFAMTVSWILISSKQTLLPWVMSVWDRWKCRDSFP